MGVGGGRRPFSCPGGPGMAHNGGGAASAAHTRRMQKTPGKPRKNGHSGGYLQRGGRSATSRKSQQQTQEDELRSP